MNKGLQKRAGRDFSLTPYGELHKSEIMLSKFKPIELSYPNFYHPFGYYESKGLNVFASFTLGGIFTGVGCALLGPVVGMSMNEFWITSSIITASFGTTMSFLNFADGDPETKIRNFFSKIFFSKRQQQKLSDSHNNEIQYMKNVKEYNDACEAYNILVQQEIEKLKAKGVFEEQFNKESKTYWYISDDGELRSMDRVDYAKKFIGENITNSTLQKEIIEKIVDNYQESQR